MTSILFLGTGAADWEIKNDIDRDVSAHRRNSY